jgi:exocyst complex component 5
LLKPYLALRSDWGQFEKGFNDAEALPDSESAGQGQALKDRFARLSVMMRELENMKVEGISMPTMPSSLTFSRSFGNSS